MKFFAMVPLYTLTFSMFVACSTDSSSSDSPSKAPAQHGAQAPSGQGVSIPQRGQTPVTNPPVTPPPVVTPQNATVDCYKGTPFICKIEKLITDKTNVYRASQRLAPLAQDVKIAFVARDWSVKQGQGSSGGLFSWFSGGISHAGFPSAREAVYQSEFQVNRSFSAENVAMESAASISGQTDADADRVATDFTDMWWNSAGHRANMLGDHKFLGCGIAQTQDGSWYGTQIFD